MLYRVWKLILESSDPQSIQKNHTWFTSRYLSYMRNSMSAGVVNQVYLFIICGIIVWIVLSRCVIKYLQCWYCLNNDLNTKRKLQWLLSYLLAISVICQICIYGTRILFMYLLMLINYYIAKIEIRWLEPLGKRININIDKLRIILTWIYVILIICVVFGDGAMIKYFSFRSLFQRIFGLKMISSGDFFLLQIVYNWCHWLDRWSLFSNKRSPILPWSFPFRMTLLRMISFNMDLNYYYAMNIPLHKSMYNINNNNNNNNNNVDVISGNWIDDKFNNLEKKSELTSQKYLANRQDCNLLSYFAYTLYFPLHIGGPMISFHDWMSQVKINLINQNEHNDEKYRRKESKLSWIMLYIARLFACVVIHQVMMYYFGQMNVKTISYALLGNGNYTPKKSMIFVNLFCLGYVELYFLYLEHLIAWRILRIWAIIGDNIITVENMPHCISNTLNVETFWRNWHASVNIWNIRYIYLPLGGKSENGNKYRYLINIALVFSFTVLWHGRFEYSQLLRALYWAGMMLFAIVLNRICDKVDNNNTYLKAVVQSIEYMLLIAGNSIGYGTKGQEKILKEFILALRYDTLNAMGSLTTFVLGFMSLSLSLPYFVKNE